MTGTLFPDVEPARKGARPQGQFGRLAAQGVLDGIMARWGGRPKPL